MDRGYPRLITFIRVVFPAKASVFLEEGPPKSRAMWKDKAASAQDEVEEKEESVEKRVVQGKGTKRKKLESITPKESNTRRRSAVWTHFTELPGGGWVKCNDPGCRSSETRGKYAHDPGSGTR